jgi:hypothetical protein
MFKTAKLTRGKVKLMFPDKEEEIDQMRVTQSDMLDGDTLEEGDADNYQNGQDGQGQFPDTAITDLGDDTPIFLKEYWYKKPVKRYAVVSAESERLTEYKTKEEAQSIISQQQAGEVIEYDGTQMRVAFSVNGKVLDDRESSFEPKSNSFPIFRYMSNYWPSSETEELKVQGVTRGLKDAQREKNKSHSQFLHILNTQANSGWIGDEDALTPEGWQALEKLGSTPGITIKKRAGKELTEIQPKNPNIGQIQREKAANDEFQQITGINPDLLGMQDSTASGKAIGMRIRQGLVSLAHMISNFRQTKEQIGCFILDIIPILMTPKRVMKIVGPQFLRDSKVSEGMIQAYLSMISDHYYDVQIAEANTNPTVRAETFESLSTLLQTPQGALIPIELIIDYMNIPNAEEVKAQIAQSRQQAMAAQQQVAGKQGAVNG